MLKLRINNLVESEWSLFDISVRSLLPKGIEHRSCHFKGRGVDAFSRYIFLGNKVELGMVVENTLLTFQA